MQNLQRALLVADGRELVRALERILGFLCEERVSGVARRVCAATSARWRNAGLSPLTRRRREGSPTDAPAVRSADRRADASTYYLSNSALARYWAADAGRARKNTG